MIEQLRFQNYKVLRDVTLEGLQPLTLLVGASGTGKSSVLEGCHQITRLGVAQAREGTTVGHRPGVIFSGEHDPVRLATRGAQNFSVELTTSEGRLFFRASAEEQGRMREGAAFSISISIRPDATDLSLPKDDRAADAYFAGPFFRELGRASLLELDAAQLARASYVEDEVPRLRADGYGLASVLSYVAGSEPARFLSIADDLRAVIRTTGRIRCLRARLTRQEAQEVRIDGDVVLHRSQREVWGDRFEVEMNSAGFIESDLLSDGTLTTLALLTELHQPDPPRLLLLDDIDQGLHPEAQAELVSVLRRLQQQHAGLQILATTHSPYLLDHLQPEEVQVLTLDANGGTRAKRLDLHPDWPRYRDMLRTGEFWSSVGEAWVAAEGS